MSLLQMLRYSQLAYQSAQMPRLPPARSARLARKRLAKLLREARAKSPFYRERLQGFDLGSVRLDELPPTSKDEIRDNFERVLTDRTIHKEEVERFISDEANLGRWFHGRYAVSHTSGTQGAPLLILQDRRSLEVLFALMSSGASVDVRPGVAEAVRRLIEPKRLAIVTFRRGFYPSGASLEFMPALVGRYVQVGRFSLTDPNLTDRLNDFQPHALAGYASGLESLADRSDALRLTRLVQISNSSEQLFPKAKARIEAAFDVPVLDHYGVGECLWLADACKTHGGMHINADWVTVEVVDDNYRPVPAGEFGSKVLVTNLANLIQPFIRYEVGDRVALATAPCTCGNRFPRIERLEGRTADLFHVRVDGARHSLPGVLWHVAIDSLDGIREWQAMQLSAERILIKLAPLDEVRESVELQQLIKRRLIAKLYELGCPLGLEIDVEFVAKLAADPSTGKMRRIVRATIDLPMPVSA